MKGYINPDQNQVLVGNNEGPTATDCANDKIPDFIATRDPKNGLVIITHEPIKKYPGSTTIPTYVNRDLSELDGAARTPLDKKTGPIVEVGDIIRALHPENVKGGGEAGARILKTVQGGHY